MTTRSGRNYKAVSETMGEQGIADLMKVLIEDRKSRDAQFEEERKRQLQAAELEKAQMREQMEMLRKLVEDSRRTEETRTPAGQAGKEGEAKLVKLSEQDDIEAYLTTFERVMRAYEIKEERWAVKLAPYLTGKAQLAYAAMRAEDTGSYRCLKDAILRRYDISEETYRRRFREAVKKEEETVSELTVRLNDLLQKWTKECKTVEDIRDMMVQEQLLDALPQFGSRKESPRRPKKLRSWQIITCGLGSMSIARNRLVVARTRDHHGARVQWMHETLPRCQVDGRR